jgi:hypothetical protein
MGQEGKRGWDRSPREAVRAAAERASQIAAYREFLGLGDRSGACNCLCPVNHRETRGVCTGQGDTSLRFDSPTIGEVDVAMCSGCVAATLAARVAKKGSR